MTGFDELGRDNLLQARLEERYAPPAGHRIVAALHCPEGDAQAAINDDAQSPFWIVPGCLTKLMTAALLRRLARDRGLDLDSLALDVLRAPDAPLRTLLTGITLRHLLEHTHGLDASELDEAPHRPDGFIDGDALASCLDRAPRAGAPGELCSYGDAGAWLSALLLEQASGRRFAEQLSELVPTCATADGEISLATSAGVCAALGGRLRMPVSSLMTFLRSALQAGTSGPPDDIRVAAIESNVRPRSGWSAADLGIYFGWSYHGAGWLGHNSIVPDAPAAARIHPERGVAFIVCTDGINPTMAAARLFGRCAPELFRVNTPTATTSAPPDDSALSTFRGRYAVQRAFYELVPNGRTMTINAYLRAALHDGGAPYATGTFVPAPRNVLIARNADPELPRFFQLIVPTEGGFRYLWDGKSALSRIEESR